MIRRAHAAAWLLGVSCVAGLSPDALAKDPPSLALRVARFDTKPGAKLDGEILQACDITKIMTDDLQRGASKKSKTAATDLALRLDSVARLRGNMSPRLSAGGTELGVTLVSAGGLELNQVFLCRKEGLINMTPAAHCSRIKKCSSTIARQMNAWLAFKLK